MSPAPRTGLIAVAAVAAIALVFSGCSSNSGSTRSGNSDTASNGSTGDATYTAAEVSAASGAYQVQPLFAVPKHLPKQYRLGFLNPGLSLPFFKTWSDGMHAAATFYGVQLDETDLNFKYDTELDQYKQLAVKQPDVVGSNPMNDATYNQAQQDGVKLVLIDGQFKDVPHFGVDDAAVGKLAIDTLASQAKAKMAAEWKGKTIDVVGLSAPNCAPCDARVKASFSEAESTLGIPSSHALLLTPPGQDPTSSAQSTFNDYLTSHPGDAVLVVSYGDEPVIGAVNAAKAAQRGRDVLAVSNGGDSAARQALRDSTNAGILLASIDYQPYAEGWNWVEAAIATEMGKPFATYDVSRVLTVANVDQFYPKN